MPRLRDLRFKSSQVKSAVARLQLLKNNNLSLKCTAKPNLQAIRTRHLEGEFAKNETSSRSKESQNGIKENAQSNHFRKKLLRPLITRTIAYGHGDTTETDIWMKTNLRERFKADQSTEVEWLGKLRELRVSYAAGWLKKTHEKSLDIGIIVRACGNPESIARYHTSSAEERRKVLYQSWRILSDDQKAREAYSALLLALNSSPKLAMFLLRDLAKIDGLELPGFIIHGVLHHAGMALFSRTSHLHSSNHGSSQATRQCFRMTLFALYQWSHLPRAVLSHTYLHRLVHQLSIWQLGKLARRILLLKTINLSAASIRLLLRRCAHFGLVRLAARLMAILSEDDRNSDATQRDFSKAISRQIGRLRYTPATERMQIVHRLIKSKVVPTNSLRNAIIRVAGECDDTWLAWQIFHRTARNNLSPSPSTFAALLSLKFQNALEVLDVVDLAARYDCLSLGVGLAAMGSLENLFRRTNWDSCSFEVAVTIISRIFDVELLCDLGILSHQHLVKFHHTYRKFPLRPSFIPTLVRLYCNGRQDQLDNWRLYQRFMQMALSGHPILGICVQRPFIFESFLMGMRKNPELLRLSTEIMQDMLDNPTYEKYKHTQSSSNEREVFRRERAQLNGNKIVPNVIRSESHYAQDKAEIRVSQPRGLTWNIFLFAVLEARDFSAADKILSLMKDKGFQHSNATWNTLIRKYAREQNIEGTVGLVEGMESAGRQADNYTKAHLAIVNNREALICALDDAMERRDRNRALCLPSQIQWETRSGAGAEQLST